MISVLEFRYFSISVTKILDVLSFLRPEILCFENSIDREEEIKKKDTKVLHPK